MLGVVFIIQPIFADRNNSFRQKWFILHLRYWLFEFKCRKIFYLQVFFVKFWGFKNCQNGYVLNYARFEEFIHIADSVTRIIYAWQVIPHNKVVPN